MYAARPGKGPLHRNRPGGGGSRRGGCFGSLFHNKVVSRMCFVAVQGSRDIGGRLGDGS